MNFTENAYAHLLLVASMKSFDNKLYNFIEFQLPYYLYGFLSVIATTYLLLYWWTGGNRRRGVSFLNYLFDLTFEAHIFILGFA